MLAEYLREGARAMGIPLTETMVKQCEKFQAMLMEANRRMNLTRVPDDPREACDRHFLDSLSPLAGPRPLAGARTILDVGAGAGFPGIPLAIALPEARVTMMDATNKRVEFLKEAIAALGLDAEAVHLRAEEAGQSAAYRERFEAVTARAVAETRTLAEWCLPFVRLGGVFVAYKGPSLDTELIPARNAIETLGGRVRGAYPAPIPGRDWDHRLLVVDKLRPTPRAYPRRPGEAAKKPL